MAAVVRRRVERKEGVSEGDLPLLVGSDQSVHDRRRRQLLDTLGADRHLHFVELAFHRILDLECLGEGLERLTTSHRRQGWKAHLGHDPNERGVFERPFCDVDLFEGASQHALCHASHCTSHWKRSDGSPAGLNPYAPDQVTCSAIWPSIRSPWFRARRTRSLRSGSALNGSR